MTYLARPLRKQALRWTGDNTTEIALFAQGNTLEISQGDQPRRLVLHTRQGPMPANVGDYIVAGLNGEYYPCAADVFEATYLPLDDGGEGYLDRLWRAADASHGYGWRDALFAVLALHEPLISAESGPGCAACSDGPYPCPTVCAIGANLGVE